MFDVIILYTKHLCIVEKKKEEENKKRNGGKGRVEEFVNNQNVVNVEICT